jgi:predicted outer membrane protein
MRLRFTSIGSALVAGLVLTFVGTLMVACAQQTSTARAASALTAPDLVGVVLAASSSEFSRRLSASRRTSSERVRELARTEVEDHARLIEETLLAAKQAGIAPRESSLSDEIEACAEGDDPAGGAPSGISDRRYLETVTTCHRVLLAVLDEGQPAENELPPRILRLWLRLRVLTEAHQMNAFRLASQRR